MALQCNAVESRLLAANCYGYEPNGGYREIRAVEVYYYHSTVVPY